MRKLTLTLIIAAFTFVACEKYDDSDIKADIEHLQGANGAQADLIKSLQEQVNALSAALASANEALASQIADNASDIAANSEAIVASNEAIAETLIAIQSLGDSTQASFTLIRQDILDTEMSLTVALDNAIAELSEAIANGDDASASALASTVEDLRAEIESAESAAIAHSDETLLAEVEQVSTTLAGLQDQIDAVTAVSFSYDESTGVITIIMADGSEYVTGDIRGEDGAPGADGVNGADGAVGPKGDTGAAGADGL